MKKAHIIAVLLLLIASGAVGAVYQFYVKERLAEYAAHLEEEKKLRTKIEELEGEFFQTKPEVVIREWKRDAQPWSSAVTQRATYFTLGDEFAEDEKPKVPEGQIPRFYYRDEFPKRDKDLRDYASTHACFFNPKYPGIPDAGVGGNPTAEDVEGWLAQMDRYSKVARMLIDNKAKTISSISIWPERAGPSGKNGTVKYQTLGLEFTADMKDLVEFLDELRMQDRYSTVDAFHIFNPSPIIKDSAVTAQLVLTQARYESKVVAPGAGPAGVSLDVDAAWSSGGGFASLGGEGGLSFGEDEEYTGPQELTWWQNFRRNWLPF